MGKISLALLLGAACAMGVAGGCEGKQGQTLSRKITPEQVVMAEDGFDSSQGPGRDFEVWYRNTAGESIYLNSWALDCNDIAKGEIYVTKICIGNGPERVNIWGPSNAESIQPLYCIVRGPAASPETVAVFERADQQMSDLITYLGVEGAVCTPKMDALKKCLEKCDYCVPQEEKDGCSDKCWDNFP